MFNIILIFFCAFLSKCTPAYLEDVCPQVCACHSLETTYNAVCDGTHVNCTNQSSSCNAGFPTNLLPLETSKLTFLKFNNFVIDEKELSKFIHLTHFSIVESNLQSFPLLLTNQIASLKFLNLSGNSIQEVHFPRYARISSLEALDLSHNSISEIYFENGSLPNLRSLYLKGNLIEILNNVENVNSLELLDISYNPIKLLESHLYKSSNLKALLLRGVPSVITSGICSIFAQCKVLPRNLMKLDLSNNSLMRAPSCDGILSGLHNLNELYLQDNHISIIDDQTFKSYCFANLYFISLQGNRLVSISENSIFGLNHLQTLILSSNYLQHISPEILKQLSTNTTEGNGISLENNFWSCDCFQMDLHDWLINEMNPVSIPCHLPQHLYEHQLRNLTKSQLRCSNATIKTPFNITAVEFSEGKLGCENSGIPKPQIEWMSPRGEVISISTIMNDKEQQDAFALSPFGEILTIRDVRLSKTGFYRCIANNSFSSTNATVTLSVLLSNTSTIIYIVVACVAFMVAIVLNSVNMCMYIYEHIKAKRLYRKALQEQDEEEKENPPIRSRSRMLDESIASLNANRHYGKYDFTCQQMFLDTVIKGAHTVKKTLYDARHSEFSMNMWEYAANLRDRLHIEVPSHVQLPNISMPNISMPTISMPSIPTMQDINTNIEKLGTSMMHRSHNLAASVGSVFALKRWMWQQHDSDGDSRESDENLESGLTRIEVEVHNLPSSTETDSQNQEISDEMNEGRSSLPFQGRMKSMRSKVFLKKVKPEKVVRFTPEEEDDVLKPLETSNVPINQAVVVRNPSLCTVSENIEKRWNSYETSL